jgi:hypothetical protein
MSVFARRVTIGAVVAAVVTCTVLFVPPWAAARRIPNGLGRAFNFPLSFFDGVSGDLVAPAGSLTTLSFGTGKVAIGALPFPLPAHMNRRLRGMTARRLSGPASTAPHVRLILTGVVDRVGPVTNTGNQLIIDAVISPGSAASNPPPFTFAFDVRAGNALLDVVLPIQQLVDGPVRIQVVGVTVADPEGQPFGVLGFELPPARPSPSPTVTPTPVGSPAADAIAPTPGCPARQCFDTITFSCTGQACGPDGHCALPNQFCDVSGHRCPCASPSPPPRGVVCCQCADAVHGCFSLPFVETQPVCPPGCNPFVGERCDPATGTCVSPSPPEHAS